MNMPICVVRIGMLGLLSCLPACSREPERDVPEAFYQAAVAMGVAQKIATNCDDLEFSSEASTILLADAKVEMLSAGLSEEDIIGISEDLSSDRLGADIAAFAQNNNLDNEKPETFCTAGKAEIKAESNIGKLLKDA